MKRYVLASLTAVSVCASVFALGAAAAPNDQTSGAPNMERMQRWSADREAVLEAKLIGMKAGLKLTADQEKLWGPFEAAIRTAQKARIDAMQDMREGRDEQMSPIDRLDAMADRLSKAGADVKQIADAAKPFYASLDETQKHAFVTLGRMLMPERGRFALEMMRHRWIEQGPGTAE
jgi:LTXXQ motif family protein